MGIILIVVYLRHRRAGSVTQMAGLYVRELTIWRDVRTVITELIRMEAVLTIWCLVLGISTTGILRGI
jgi:hypothetical protein